MITIGMSLVKKQSGYMNLLNSWIKIARAVVLGICLLGANLTVIAAEMPSGWPWHGVSMDSLSSKPEDIQRYRDRLSIDTVRLQLKPDKLAKRDKLSPDEAWQQSLQWLDSMLDQCKKLHIRAIVNLSYFPIDSSYAPNSKIKIPQYTPEFWSDQAQLDGVVATASKLMQHLQVRGDEFAAIDIMSEPAIQERGRLVVPRNWEGLMTRVVKAVRSVRSGVWILISPPPQGKATSYFNFKPFADDRIIYNAHIYIPSMFANQGIMNNPVGVDYPGYVDARKWDDHVGKVWDAKELRKALQPMRDFQDRYDVPVIIGEFSAVRWANGGEKYIQDLAHTFDELGWGWLYFSATGWHGWNPDYNRNYPGLDEASHGAWRKDYVGESSERWITLHTIFKVQGITK